MDKYASPFHQVIETTSTEQAKELRKRGWIVLSIGKGHDANGEAFLKYALGWTQGAAHPSEAVASNDHAHSRATHSQKSS